MTDVVIFAAGLGSRLGLGLPKCLVHVSGKPILQYQLDAINSALDQCVIHVITGYRHKLVEEFLVRYRGKNRVVSHYNPFFKDIGILGSAWIARQFVTSTDVLRLDGDVVITAENIDKLMRQEHSTLLTVKCSYGKRTAVARIMDGNRVHGISLEEVYSGPHEWICVERYCKDDYTRMMDQVIDCLPMTAYYFEAMNLYFQNGPQLLALQADHVYEIDTPEDLKMTEAELAYAAKN